MHDRICQKRMMESTLMIGSSPTAIPCTYNLEPRSVAMVDAPPLRRQSGDKICPPAALSADIPEKRS